MVKEYKDDGNFLPTACLKEDGAMVKGIMKSKRDVKTKWGLRPVYTLTVLDASCRFLRGEEEVQPDPNTDIDVFTTTRLATQLAKVPVGETITIKYMGTVPSGKGNPAHKFSVKGE